MCLCRTTVVIYRVPEPAKSSQSTSELHLHCQYQVNGMTWAATCLEDKSPTSSDSRLTVDVTKMWISHPGHPCWRWWWMAVVVVMTLQVITPIYSQECNTLEGYGSRVQVCVAPFTFYWWLGPDISTIFLQLPARNKTIQVNSSHHQRWHEVSGIREAARKNPAPRVSAKIYSLSIPTLSVEEHINCSGESSLAIFVVGNEKMYLARNCTNFPTECPDKTGVKCPTTSPAPGQGGAGSKNVSELPFNRLIAFKCDVCAVNTYRRHPACLCSFCKRWVCEGTALHHFQTCIQGGWQHIRSHVDVTQQPPTQPTGGGGGTINNPQPSMSGHRGLHHHLQGQRVDSQPRCSGDSLQDLPHDRVTAPQDAFEGLDMAGEKSTTSSPAPGKVPWYYPVAVVAFVLLVGLISFIVFKHIRRQKTRVRDTALVRYSHVQEPGPGGAPKLALSVETVSSHDAGTENPYSEPEEVITHTDDGRRGSSHDSENSIYGWQPNYAVTQEDYVN